MKKLIANLCIALCFVVAVNADPVGDVMDWVDTEQNSHRNVSTSDWQSFSEESQEVFRIKEDYKDFVVKAIQNTDDWLDGTTLYFYTKNENKLLQTLSVTVVHCYFNHVDIDNDGFEEIAFVSSYGSGGMWYGFVCYDKESGRFSEVNFFEEAGKTGNYSEEDATGNIMFSPATHRLFCSEMSGAGYRTNTLYKISSTSRGPALSRCYTIISEAGEDSVSVTIKTRSRVERYFINTSNRNWRYSSDAQAVSSRIVDLWWNGM